MQNEFRVLHRHWWLWRQDAGNTFFLASNLIHPPRTSMPRISPGSQSTTTSNGRQQTSQSVVKRWDATLVSMANSKLWPQKGHWTVSVTCICATAFNA
jgi:hypothetical protein